MTGLRISKNVRAIEVVVLLQLAVAAAGGAPADRKSTPADGGDVGSWQLDYRPEDLSGVGLTPFRSLPQSYIDKALKDNVDWRKKGVVTVAKGQTGGNCGTWARTSAGESSYALGGGGGTGIAWPNGHAVNRLRNFSEQQSLDCVPPGEGGSWFFYNGGLESLEDYPTNRTDHGKPGAAPCKLDKSKIIPGTGGFTNRTDPQHALDHKINKSVAKGDALALWGHLPRVRAPPFHLLRPWGPFDTIVITTISYYRLMTQLGTQARSLTTAQCCHVVFPKHSWGSVFVEGGWVRR